MSVARIICKFISRRVTQNARRRNFGESARGRGRGQVTVNPGRRIRARGNRACPRREAWRAVGEAGYRDRFIEGASRRGEAASSRPCEDQREHARKALSDSKKSGRARKTSAKRSQATMNALKKEGPQAASSKALSRQAKSSAMKRTRKERSAAGKKAAKTRARTR